MYSNSHYVNVDAPESSIESCIKKHFDPVNFQAFLLIEVFPEDNNYYVLLGYKIDSNPFNGSEKDFLTNALDSCFQKYPYPHYHNIGSLGISNRIKKFCSDSTKSNRVLFYPFSVLNKCFIIFGFCTHDSRKKTIDEADERLISNLSLQLRGNHLLRYNDSKMAATEMYIKEIGHDISSSAQAIFGKLNAITLGIYTGKDAQRKSKEAEDELQAIVRVSDSIGVTIDEKYQVQQFLDFDFVDLIYKARDRHYSEAKEQHIQLETDLSTGTCPYIGDDKAIEIAIGHYILNAIKYSYGSSKVTIKLISRSDGIELSVTNQSKIALPRKEEEFYIWDFGFRSEGAKEAHVNGSGIGLYTARKIVTCHFGLTCFKRFGSKGTIAFYMKFPSKREAQMRIKENLGTV